MRVLHTHLIVLLVYLRLQRLHHPSEVLRRLDLLLLIFDFIFVLLKLEVVADLLLHNSVLVAFVLIVNARGLISTQLILRLQVRDHVSKLLQILVVSILQAGCLLLHSLYMLLRVFQLVTQSLLFSARGIFDVLLSLAEFLLKC